MKDIHIIACPKCQRKIRKSPSQMGNNKTHNCICGCRITFEGNGARDVQRSVNELQKAFKSLGR